MTLSAETVAVAIPTRNRPEKLDRCLAALESAREHLEFAIVVGDSSQDDAMHAAVAAVCAKYKDLRLIRHNGKNVSAARNACGMAADADIIVNLDDDVYVEPHAIAKLVAAYRAGSGHRVAAGSVLWGEQWSRPIKMRLIGYGREVLPGERPDFLIGAFFAYSAQVRRVLPFNELVRTSDDRFMGALWRSHKVTLLFEPDARAIHDHQHNSYSIEHQRSHIYANLFDAVIANPDPLRMFTYEFLGFLWGLKLALKRSSDIPVFLKAWTAGHQDLARDWSTLRAMVERPLPDTPDVHRSSTT